MLQDALNSKPGLGRGIKKDKREKPWFLEAERICQVMISNGSTRAIAEPGNVAERVAVERAKTILGIK